MLLESLLSLLRESATLTRQIQHDFITPTTWEKKDKSPVTVGDLAVQTLMAARLEQLCPEIPLVAEESTEVLESDEGERFGEILRRYLEPFLGKFTRENMVHWIARGKEGTGTSRFWTLDPIDGTKGFLRREQYATALALVEENRVTMGFLGLPNYTQGENLVHAVRGKGTWANDLWKPGEWKACHVSEHRDVQEATVLRSVESGHTNLSQMDILVRNLGVVREPVRMDSQAKYAVLASGKSDFLFRLISAKQPHYKEKIWDQAAGSIILEEAGGKVTDLDGKDLDFSHGETLEENRGICASNGILHNIALDAIIETGC
ncbi:MAG: inositol monophosphatase family protein [Planctomycetia bacterium]|nr:inositol monophosphatase family protein [Planctomycetia bacterium]